MSVLRVSLFGGVRIAHDGWVAESKTTRAVQALLAYLLLHREQPHRREVLAGLFWGEHSEARARSCLSTALWRLRGVLEPDGIARGSYLVITPTGEVGFNRQSDHWLDVAVFEQEVSRVLALPVQAMEADDARSLAEVLQLHTGELLEGLFDDWVVRERERLRSLYLNSLARLMRYYRRHGAYDDSLSWGRQILHNDPLREEIHREMMRLYLESGQRALAVRQYEACRDVLAVELDIPPMEETQALYRQIVSAGASHRVHPAGSGGAGDLQQALQQLGQAVQGFNDATQQLHRAIQLLQRLVDPSAVASAHTTQHRGAGRPHA